MITADPPQPTAEPQAPPKTTPPETTAPRKSLVWTVWPLRDRFHQTWWAPVAVAALSLLVWRRLESPGCGLLAGAALATALLSVWAPVSYKIQNAGLHIRSLGRRSVVPWSRVRTLQLRGAVLTLWIAPVGKSRRNAGSVTPVRVLLRRGDRAATRELRHRAAKARELPADRA